MTLRVRLCEPASHVREQAPQLDHSVTTQLTGHGEVLQATSSVTYVEQARPSLAAGVVTPRVRDLVPPPQVAVHEPQALHDSITQSTGHAPRLQVPVSVISPAGGHAVPSLAAGVMTDITRVVLPTPQDVEQELQLDQSVVTQLTGQAEVPHAVLSVT